MSAHDLTSNDPRLAPKPFRRNNDDVPRTAAASYRSPSAVRSWLTMALAVCVLLTLFRLMSLIVSPLELGPDEAQYWRWAKTPDWGYFSKPPLIAWAIAATTQAFGDYEWAVRLSAPIAHAVCALFVARAANDLAGKFAGAPAALLYLSAPGVALSSFIMSTDALLLATAAIALAATVRLRRRPTLATFAVLGLALGLGTLAKYAMVYTILGIVIAALLDKTLRRNLLQPHLAISALIAAALIGPNLYWNATHSFATFQHTAANADWAAAKFDLKEVGEFLAAQFGVFGPLAFALLPFALFARTPKREADQSAAEQSASPALPAKALLAALIILPIATISIEALINRANANWAAIAYPAAAVAVTIWCVRTKRPRLLFAAIAINSLLSLGVLIGTAAPSLADKIGASNSIKRARGWDDITRSIAQAAAEGPGNPDQRYQAVVFDNRLIFHEVDYYGRTRLLPPLRMWRKTAAPMNQAQASAPLNPGSGPFLFVLSTPLNLNIVSNDFARFEPRGGVTVFLKGGKTRHVDFYLAEGYAPTPRDAAYEDRWSKAPKDSLE